MNFELKHLFFKTSNSLQDMTDESFTGSKLYDVRRTLGVNFSKHVLAKTAKMQRINAPSIFNLMPSNLASS